MSTYIYIYIYLCLSRPVAAGVLFVWTHASDVTEAVDSNIETTTAPGLNPLEKCREVEALAEAAGNKEATLWRAGPMLRGVSAQA